MKRKGNKDKKDNDDSGSTNIFKFFESFRKLLWKAKIYNLSLKNLLKVDKRELQEVETYSKLEELLTVLKIFKKNKLIYTNNNMDKSEQFIRKNSNVNSIKILNLSNNDNKIINNLIIIGSNTKRTINNIFSFDNIKKEYIKPFIEIIKKKINEFEQMFDTIKSAVKSIIFGVINTSIDLITSVINKNVEIIDFGGTINNYKNIRYVDKIDKNTEIIDNPMEIICNDKNNKNDNKDSNIQSPDNFNSYNPPIDNNGNNGSGNNGHSDNGDNNDEKGYEPNNPLNTIPPAPTIFPTINNGDDGINNNNYINGEGHYNESNNNDLFGIINETNNMVNDNIDQLSDILNNLREINNNNFNELDNEIGYDDWDNFNLNKTGELEDNHYYKGDITNDLEELNNELDDCLLSKDEISPNPLNP